MDYFAVFYTYADDAQRLDQIRPEHRAFLAGLEQLVASGPLPGTEPARALLIFRANSADELSGLLDSDPFRAAGLIAHREVLPWQPVLGVFAS